MNLTEKQRKVLRRLGHKLKPIIYVGHAGVSEPLLKELDQSLAHHELLKVSVRVADRGLRNSTIDDLASHCGAELIQTTGHMALLYRRNPETPKIKLS